MDIKLLEKSCNRLPKLLELNAPTGMLLNELRILNNLALEAIHESVGRDLRARLTALKAAKKAEATIAEKET